MPRIVGFIVYLTSLMTLLYIMNDVIHLVIENGANDSTIYGIIATIFISGLVSFGVIVSLFDKKP